MFKSPRWGLVPVQALQGHHFDGNPPRLIQCSKTFGARLSAVIKELPSKSGFVGYCLVSLIGGKASFRGLELVLMVSFCEYMNSVDQVEGWLNETTAIISNAIIEFQTRSEIGGNICEIGVHHGRYFIAMAAGLAKNEKAIAIDLFGNQNENTDKSGEGNRPIFEANVARFLNPQSIAIIENNSLRVGAEQILDYGPVRFFSVDGGHTELLSEHDLRLAEKTLVQGGIVAMDDILHYYWTGVIGGVARYKFTGGKLVGFAIIPGKLLMCAAQYSEFYRKFLQRTFSVALNRKDAEFLGDAVDLYKDIPQSELLRLYSERVG